MNRVAVITGAAGGIGLACARLFKEKGWRVVGVDLKPAEDDIFDLFQQLDVSLAEDVESLFAAVAGSMGRVDALVNNAAIQLCSPLIETNPEQWDQVLSVNLKSVYLTARCGYPLLAASGGAVVNIGSVHVVATSAKIAAYAAAKGGVVALTRALAVEFAPLVRVNAVLPGATDTGMLRAGLSRGHLEGEGIEEKLRILAAKTVLQRVGDPTEVAQAIIFLADFTTSSFITGHSLVVDGGALVRLSTE